MVLRIGEVRALCFDVDGTLSDTDDQVVRTLTNLFTPVRFAFRNRDPLPFARKIVMFIESPGNLIFGLPDRLGIDSVLHTVGNWLHPLRMGKPGKPFWAIPGMAATLHLLHEHYPMCVVSARDQRSTERFLKQFEITSLFRCVATANTCQHTKPFADPILWAAAQMGVSAPECLMIGDTTVDIRAGKAAGAQTVGVLSGFGELEELERYGADLILPSVAELPGVLLSKT
ncbi:MAG: HAD family hydrolase [Chloroflexota bacterium]